MDIKIKYLKDILPIEPCDVGDWIDLRAAEDVHMAAGEYKLIPLGVAMELPKGYEALVAPRSSTFRKYHIMLATASASLMNRTRAKMTNGISPHTQCAIHSLLRMSASASSGLLSISPK